MSYVQKIKAENNTQSMGQAIKRLLDLDYLKVIHVVDGPNDENFWAETSNHIGALAPMEEDQQGNKTGRPFTDIKHPWHINSNSFSHSNTRQPLHTDGSYESNAPNITFFSCLEAPVFGGKTTFLELKALKFYLEEYDRNLLERLQNEIVTHGKGNDSKTKTIICDNKLTWNYYRCEPCKLRDDFHHFLENYVVGGELTDGIALLPGEALFFKDEDILHGRTSFIGRRWLIKGGIYV